MEERKKSKEPFLEMLGVDSADNYVKDVLSKSKKYPKFYFYVHYLYSLFTTFVMFNSLIKARSYLNKKNTTLKIYNNGQFRITN